MYIQYIYKLKGDCHRLAPIECPVLFFLAPPLISKRFLPTTLFFPDIVFFFSMLRSNCLRRTDALGGGVKGTRHYYSFKPKHKGRTNKSARQGVGEEKSWNEKTKETDGLPYSLYYWQGCIMLGEKREKKKGDKHGSERATHVKDGNARWGTAASSSLLTRSGAVHAAESFKRTRQTGGTHRKAYILCSSLLIYTLQATSRIGWGLFSFAFCQLQTDTQTSRPTLLAHVDETHWSPSAIARRMASQQCRVLLFFVWANQSKVIGLLSYRLAWHLI